MYSREFKGSERMICRYEVVISMMFSIVRIMEKSSADRIVKCLCKEAGKIISLGDEMPQPTT